MSGPIDPLAPFRREFERCWPWIEDSLKFVAFKGKNGELLLTHEKKHVWERLVNGKTFLWPGKECVILTEFHVTPTGLKAHHTWLAGGNLQEIKEMMPIIEEWGRKRGCLRQTGSGRRGWLRVFDGYHEIGVRKAKDFA